MAKITKDIRPIVSDNVSDAASQVLVDALDSGFTIDDIVSDTFNNLDIDDDDEEEEELQEEDDDDEEKEISKEPIDDDEDGNQEIDDEQKGKYNIHLYFIIHFLMN